MWLAAVVALVLAAGEWLRAPGPWPVVFASGGAIAIAGMVILGRDPDGARWSALLTAWLAAALALALGATEVHRASLRRDWSVEESRLATRAEQQTLHGLDALGDRLTQLVGEAVRLGPMPPERGFDAMAALIPRNGPDIALALLDARGRPEVWAGRHRLPLVQSSDSVVLRRSAFYAILEVRRHRPGGGTALGAVLLGADAAVPAAPASLAGSIAEGLGVGVGFEPAGGSGAGGALWPAVHPVLRVTLDPRAPGDAVSALLDRAGLVLGLLLLAFVIAAAAAASQIPARYLVLALLSWLVVRAPLDQALRLEQPFSSASFYSPLLGFLSSSAGSLAIAGTLGLVVFVGAWRARFRRGRLSLAVAVLLLLATPYVVRELGRGIRPPAADVPLSLWLTWHLALLATAAALLTAAAALQRTEPVARRAKLFAGLGAAWGLGAAVVGVLAYTGSPAWPTWYTALWLPAGLLATRPAPRLWTILVIGVVAGAGASLMTWGAAITGRTAVALRDVAALGSAPDSAAGPLLADFSQQVARQPPGDAASLYRLWRGSSLRREGYPARLTIWSDGRVLDDVVLDGLSVTDSALAALAGSADSVGRFTVARLAASPGAHYLLAMKLDPARTLTVAIGPRSVLIAPAPLGRLLETGPARSTLYRLSLTPAAADRIIVGAQWRREGWALRSVQPVTLPDGPVDANVLIPIGRPGSIYVRGALLILVDVAIIWLFWLGAERAAGAVRERRRWRLLLGSYQARLAVALGVFFLTPAALLALLSIRQLTGEAAQTRDLVLQQVLRDATPLGGFAGKPGDASLGSGLALQAHRVDADLGLYRDGQLTASSDPLLVDLAVFPRLLDADAFHSIHLDGDLTAAPRSGAGPARAGYAAAGLATGGMPVVVATVAPASDRALRERQADVGYTLVLVTLLGVLASLGAARAAARALSQPVADLRDSAIAFGRGDPVPPARRAPPQEFAPVFDAFGRMAADVRASQAALEAARRRTELVLATVSTGVIALDAKGHVLLANHQAAEALGGPLMAGSGFRQAMSGEWAPLGTMVERMLAQGSENEGGIEVDVGDRRYVVRVASLGGELGGLVLAVTDVTEATRAARVLAWADVANQIAHAIKNPLTPLRLGMQHLARVREERPEQFDATLRETSARILAEIDRLDAIARAFARFAAPSAETLPLEAVEVAATLQEVAALYHLAPGVTVLTDAPPGATVLARREELTEVLLNLCDNAANAGATAIAMRVLDGLLTVQDNGRGIAPEHVARIFEPRFSTTSSGSGLGLAIVRRVVEGWGGTVTADSRPRHGTTFYIRFQPVTNVPAGRGE